MIEDIWIHNKTSMGERTSCIKSSDDSEPMPALIPPTLSVSMAQSDFINLTKPPTANGGSVVSIDTI